MQMYELLTVGCSLQSQQRMLWRRRRKYVLNQKSQNPPPVHQALQKVHLKAKLRMKEAGEESVKEELKQNSQENGERRRRKKRIQDASEPQTKDAFLTRAM